MIFHIALVPTPVNTDPVQSAPLSRTGRRGVTPHIRQNNGSVANVSCVKNRTIQYGCRVETISVQYFCPGDFHVKLAGMPPCRKIWSIPQEGRGGGGGGRQYGRGSSFLWYSFFNHSHRQRNKSQSFRCVQKMIHWWLTEKIHWWLTILSIPYS